MNQPGIFGQEYKFSNKNDMGSAWRNFTIVFKPEMLEFNPYSILTRDTVVKIVIFCLLSSKGYWWSTLYIRVHMSSHFQFKKRITICWGLWSQRDCRVSRPGKTLLRTLESSRFLNSALFWCFENWFWLFNQFRHEIFTFQ